MEELPEISPAAACLTERDKGLIRWLPAAESVSVPSESRADRFSRMGRRLSNEVRVVDDAWFT